MEFLIDEDLSRGIAQVFSDCGFGVQRVARISELRGKSDEVIFEYARVSRMIIATADLGFPNLVRFFLSAVPGMVLLRFPNEMPDAAVCAEVRKSVSALSEQDFQGHLIVIEPGIIRVRPLSEI